MGGSPNLSLTPRDRELLWFMAEHRMVLERQIAALLGSRTEPIRRRLQRLAGAGYLTRFAVLDGVGCCRIRARGLAAVGSQLPVPKENLGAYRHDAGVAWLWLAARRGVFGPVAEVLGERRIRSHDATGLEEPYSIRLGGYDGKGKTRRHYPDLVLVSPRGNRLALELELSPKEIPRREKILAAYAADRRLEAVLYLIEDNRDGGFIGRAIARSASHLGISEHVHVRPVTGIAPEGRVAESRRLSAGIAHTTNEVGAAR